MNKEQLTITLPLSDFICSHLGISCNSTTGLIERGQHIKDKMPISFELAEIILSLTQNKHTCFIEEVTPTSWHREPLLWGWNDWITSEEKRVLHQKWSHNERVQRFLKEQNVQAVAKAYFDEMGGAFDMEHCTKVAMKWVTENSKGAIHGFLGIKKLKTKEEEL